MLGLLATTVFGWFLRALPDDFSAWVTNDGGADVATSLRAVNMFADAVPATSNVSALAEQPHVLCISELNHVVVKRFAERLIGS